MQGLESRFAGAFARRAALRTSENTIFRAFNGRADGVADVTVDWFAGVAILSLYRSMPADQERAVTAALAKAISPRAVYLKRRPREARVVANVAKSEVAPPGPVFGEQIDELIARENGAAFAIRPGQGLSVGLYLDMRDTRAWLGARVKGRTVLNTFAYTCGFGVYARRGGAARAVNLDLSRRVLDWGEENLRHNGFEPDRRDHLAGDTFEWLRRFARKGERFDVVILDPPSFSTTRKGAFSTRRDYPKLVAAALPVVAPGGTLLCCSNLEDLPGPKFEALVRQGFDQVGARGRVTERLGPSAVDFPSDPEEPPALKVRAYQVP